MRRDLGLSQVVLVSSQAQGNLKHRLGKYNVGQSTYERRPGRIRRRAGAEHQSGQINMMIWVLSILLALSCAALGFLIYKRIKAHREHRMDENEYQTAVTLWNFARLVKDELDQLNKGRVEVLDFNKISLPHGSGYRISLELSGFGFSLFAVPERYNRTGRLSLYVNNSLTVRALDRGGQAAESEDPEYTGDSTVAHPAA